MSISYLMSLSGVLIVQCDMGRPEAQIVCSPTFHGRGYD